MRYFVASICQKGLDKELVLNTLLPKRMFCETIIEAELPTNIVAKFKIQLILLPYVMLHNICWITYAA